MEEVGVAWAKQQDKEEVAVVKERLHDGVIEEAREEHVNLAEPKINI